jgi:hypothetical protein
MLSWMRKLGEQVLELDVGGAGDGAAVEVRRDLDVVGLRHAGDLLALQDAADPAEGRLQDGRGALLQQLDELVLGGQPLAGGDGNGLWRGHPRHLVDIGRRGGLLEPQRIAASSRRARRMAPGVIWPWVPNSRSQRLPTASRRVDEHLAAVQGLQGKLARVEGGVGPAGSNLTAVNPIVGVLHRRALPPGPHRYTSRSSPGSGYR